MTRQLLLIDLAGLIVGGSGLAFLVVGLTWWFYGTAWYPVDAGTYLLAGARLNSGGWLYDLRPQDYIWPWGDRQFPLYGPPLMGAVGRFLDAGGGPALLAWLVATGSSALWSVLMSLKLTVGWSGLALFAVTGSITLLIGVGNADGLVMAAILLAWLLPGRIRGVLIGFAVSLKL